MRVQEEKKRNKLEIISQYRKLIGVGGQHLLEWELLCSSSMLTIFFDPKLELLSCSIVMYIQSVAGYRGRKKPMHLLSSLEIYSAELYFFTTGRSKC
jgi:hypothetical protein